VAGSKSRAWKAWELSDPLGTFHSRGYQRWGGAAPRNIAAFRLPCLNQSRVILRSRRHQSAEAGALIPMPVGNGIGA